MKKKSNTMFLTQSAVIAAIYVVLTLALQPISFGTIQFRVSEMLCVLPLFSFTGVVGVTIGCLLGNILGGAALPDIIFGTLATLIGAVGTHYLCCTMKNGQRERSLSIADRIKAVLPPIISNMLIIPLVLKFAYGMADAVWFMVITVGVGEILAVGVLGNILLTILYPYSQKLFLNKEA